jgi:hypothetical protein
MSRIVFDAATPPTTTPPDVTGALGYIGGRALHTWTPAQWQPFAGLRQFPAWVADFAASPSLEAGRAVEAALDLGWAPHLPAAETRVIVCDLETSVVPSWYQAWAQVVTANGFLSVAYGSLSTVLGNAASDVIAADFDGIAQLPPGQTVHGIQYRADVEFGGTQIDLSFFDSWLMARGGVGPRHGAS